VNEQLMTNELGPVAQPRLTNRPEAAIYYISKTSF
jgi:hypothetical protein